VSRSPDGVFFCPVDVLSLQFGVLGRLIALIFDSNVVFDRPGVNAGRSVVRFGGEEGQVFTPDDEHARRRFDLDLHVAVDLHLDIVVRYAAGAKFKSGVGVSGIWRTFSL
jgi:hypothetical protein